MKVKQWKDYKNFVATTMHNRSELVFRSDWAISVILNATKGTPTNRHRIR